MTAHREGCTRRIDRGGLWFDPSCSECVRIMAELGVTWDPVQSWWMFETDRERGIL